MRTLPLHLARQRGFTLAETMIATGILGLVGAAAGYVLINGTVLFAKNTASNLAHDQNRIAVSRLVRDIHSAVSTPQLGRIVKGKVGSHPTAPAGSWTPYGTNVTFWAEPGAGPAAGISFKKMGNSTNPYGGPFNVRNDPGNKDLIQIDSDANAPHEGMDIVFPYYLDTNGRKMEGTIYKVTSNGVNHYNVFVDGGLETRIKKKKDTSVICYYMSRFAYVVENGELKFYGSCMPPPGTTWP
ncbi:MAG TPA: type II secretion system protein, partial [Chthoniobacterales bacterium]